VDHAVSHQWQRYLHQPITSCIATNASVYFVVSEQMVLATSQMMCSSTYMNVLVFIPQVELLHKTFIPTSRAMICVKLHVAKHPATAGLSSHTSNVHYDIAYTPQKLPKK
jgi:hypothetical protein